MKIKSCGVKILEPISELIYIFENSNPRIFNDLSSRLSFSENKKNEFLYKNTRGNLDALNIGKLYDLYKKDKFSLST